MVHSKIRLAISALVLISFQAAFAGAARGGYTEQVPNAGELLKAFLTNEMANSAIRSASQQVSVSSFIDAQYKKLTNKQSALGRTSKNKFRTGGQKLLVANLIRALISADYFDDAQKVLDYYAQSGKDGTYHTLERTLADTKKIQSPKQRKYAFIAVDVQYDFMELPFTNQAGEKVGKGSLAVGGTGQDYLDAVNAFNQLLIAHGVRPVFTADWHPVGHMSFASSWLQADGTPAPVFAPMQADYRVKGGTPCAHYLRVDTKQNLWPNHCVQKTPGARIPAQHKASEIVYKGVQCQVDSYSGFMDNDEQTKSKMLSHLTSIVAVIVYGIATDYCVRATALHAKKAGFDTYLVTNLSRGVSPEGSLKAMQEMNDAGITLIDVKGLGAQSVINTSSLPVAVIAQ